MDKNAIKKFAIWARKELISRVTQRAYLYGIDGESELDADQKEVNGQLLSAVELKQRRQLVKRIKEKGFESVMDEAAYTWFNRFAALRYMEVNGVLPTRVRVFTDWEGHFHPQILDDCLTIENLEGIDKEIVFALKEQDKTDELYKYLLITQCNALGSILPAMFEQIEDYTELLLPDNLLREGSVIEQMVTMIPEDDWRDAVQIIGWLYQYYNSEPKDAVFAALKKNVKVSKENIPAATQLFTPDWIVRYMVENSLGRVWIEHKLAAGPTFDGTIQMDGSASMGAALDDEAAHQYEKDFAERMDWKYYLPEAKQEPEVAKKLKELRDERRDLRPEEIKVIDPCMGSGHILVYAFDVLVQIYKEAGYQPRNAPELILKNNLFGLDIDDRAYQLAYFAVMMRAWHYNHRILNKHIEPHLCAIQESNGMKKWSELDVDMSGEQITLDNQFIQMADELIDTFRDAKEYGSILTVPEHNYDALLNYIKELKEQGSLDLMHSMWLNEVSEKMPVLVRQAKVMSVQYTVCITNPPYMSAGNMNRSLSDYIKSNYDVGKTDYYAAFIIKCLYLLKYNGYMGMMTSYTWMFLSAFEKLRSSILHSHQLCSLVQPEYHSFFEEAFVPICSFILNREKVDYTGTFIRLQKFYGPKIQSVKYLEAISDSICDYKYTARQSIFLKIPGNPIAYWFSNNAISKFLNKNIKDIADAMKGLDTCDNDRFVREWYEVDINHISFDTVDTNETYKHKWYPYAKGGGFKKWYGFLDKIVNWEDNGYILRNLRDKNGKIKSRPQNIHHYFREGLTWSTITSYKLSLRIMSHSIFGGGGSALFPTKNKLYVLALLNSNIADYYLNMMNQTLNFLVKDILSIPLIESNISEIESLSDQCISSSKLDYNINEISPNFYKNCLCGTERVHLLKECYLKAKKEINNRFTKLQSNEEHINQLFIDIYGLQKEISSNVAERDVTVSRIYDTNDEIPDSMKGNDYVLTKEDVVKSLLSYAVGCMFGRYSLDVPGLAYAGGDFDWSKYSSFKPDEDDIIPICDDEYFEDDIVDRFCDWLKVVYGEEHYQENLQFISDALGGKGTPLENIRSYFLNDFYKDHCKTYKKRPIYWLFDAGKKNSFKALVYIHRYDRDTMARMRTNYVYKQQELYKSRIETFKNRVDTAATQADKNKNKKELKKLQDQFDEIHAYEEKIHHYADLRQEIDLDDGVKHNYALFADVLAKIK